MPTPAAHINEYDSNQQIVWSLTGNHIGSGSTGLFPDNFSKEGVAFFHSKQLGFIESDLGTFNDILISNTDRKFINFKKSFKVQFDSLFPQRSNLAFEEANEKLTSSLSSLLNINPDIISMELTREQSVFYTVKKNEYTLFFQHFLNDIEEDEDEAILTAFKKNDKLPSYAGSLSQTISEFYSLLNPVSDLKLELELHELSF